MTINLIDPFGLRVGGGHHIIPWSIFNGKVSKAVQDFFNSDFARIANEFYKNHNGKTLNGVTHPQYARLVREELEKFLGEQKIHDMTLDQAKAFLDKIRRMPVDSRIGMYLKGVADEAATAMKRGLEAAAKKAGRSAARRAMGKGAKTVSKGIKGCKGIPIIGTVVTIVFVVDDIREKGFWGGVANSTLDAIPLLGTAKIVSEAATGVEIVEDKP